MVENFFFFFNVRNKEEEKSGLCLYYNSDHPSKEAYRFLIISKQDYNTIFKVNNIIKNDNVFDNEVYPWKVKAVSDSFDLSPAIWYKEDLK